VLWGALTALYRNRLPDTIIMFLVILGISVPSFVFAALGQLALVNVNRCWACRCCRWQAGAMSVT
jgi:ABC-type dipeptide/oligopeptide/nickel transport system permease component